MPCGVSMSEWDFDSYPEGRIESADIADSSELDQEYSRYEHDGCDCPIVAEDDGRDRLEPDNWDRRNQEDLYAVRSLDRNHYRGGKDLRDI